MKKVIFGIISVILAACGSHDTPQKPEVLVGPNADYIVVRSRATIEITTSSRGKVYMASMNKTQPVTVTNAVLSSMTLDNSEFAVPSSFEDVADLGYLKITQLRDNDLKVCGASGTDKCGQALIRVYTTGVGGAGLWNTVDSYGAPLSAALTTPLTVGLDVAGAVTMQTYTIPGTKRVVRLSDFSPNPRYNFKADFSEAGAGTFTTTIVVEYALAP